MNQWRKDIASWRCGGTLYLSVPFTWMMPQAKAMAKQHKGRVVAGGPAVDLIGADWAETPGTCQFDTLSMHNPCATFTTRGCPNRCEFCAVPKIEGDFRELDTWKPAPVLCDNNLTASSHRHFERVIDSVLDFPKVDFNQGLQAGKFTRWHAGQIARLRRAKVRFAFDHVNAEGTVADALETARAAGLHDFGVYVLIGFKDTPDDARYRLDRVRQLGIRPNPMRYQPLNATKKNEYVSPKWTSQLLHDMMRYYSCLRWLEHIPFEKYQSSFPKGGA